MTAGEPEGSGDMLTALPWGTQKTTQEDYRGDQGQAGATPVKPPLWPPLRQEAAAVCERWEVPTREPLC